MIIKLDSNKTNLNDYFKRNVFNLLYGNVDAIPKFANYSEINLQDSFAYKVFLNTTLFAEPGVNDIGNSINQSSFHIWTLKNDYFYDILFNAFESAYTEYYPIIVRIVNSIQIKD